MPGLDYPSPHKILIASANPLFSKGLKKLFSNRWKADEPEMRLVSSMDETLNAMKDWLPDLVVVDYDDRTINRSEFLNHFVTGSSPMQVMLVSLQASGEAVVYDRRTLTPAQAESWFHSYTEDQPGAAASSTSRNLENQSSALEQTRSEFHFNWKWVLLTIVVLALIAAFIRLGFWQLDRLAQRRAYNARVTAETNLPPLDLNQSMPSSQAFSQMEYRPVIVTGQYDFSQEVVLGNQVYQGRLGAHVLTPLKIQNSPYLILVDRGWIPLDSSDPQMRARYQETGVVTVKGMLRASQPPRTVIGISASNPQGSGRKDAWAEVDLKGIQAQSSDRLLPMFIQESQDPGWTSLPYRTPLEIQLTEGPHLGYAIQWFLFAAIAAIGFPILIRRQMRPSRGRRKMEAAANPAGRSNHHQA